MSEMVKSRKKGVTAYAQNPFLGSVHVEVGSKRITVSSGMHIDTKTGEAVEHSGVHIVRDVERSQFVKLYTREMKRIFELRPTSLKILQYLLAEMQKWPNADSIYLHWFSADRYFQEQDIGVSRASFQRGMLDLLHKNIIAESVEPNRFWLNPAFFWNGDRYRFINEYRMKENVA